MDSVLPPTKSCHNCRRQRLRCDRSYPHCNKCTAAGKECLGYGKLFRWTGAIASRGKLAGRTSSAPLDALNAPEPTPAKLDMRRVRSVSASPREIGTRNGGLGNSKSPTDAESDGNNMHLIPRARSADVEVSSPWMLIDPLFQDLDPSQRYYLSYFTNRLCKDLVSQDLPDCNPFRSLISLTKAHPLLQHIIVAASATHMSNLFRASLPPASDDTGMIVSNHEQASKRALNDALVAKHKALRLMYGALQDMDSIGGDVVLAATIFFINVELIESGKYGWRAHLEGAAKIISFLQPTKVWDSALRDYLLSDCFIYFVLASAFTSTSLNFESSQIPFVLGKTVANSYLCCPPEIMEILHAASQLSNITDTSTDEVTAAAAALLDRAQAFDIFAWAGDVHSMSSLRDYPIESRMHAGSAHRLAACLYILQAIPLVTEKVGNGLAESLSQEIFEHLSSIPEDDPNFKAITWPTFIAGAEATNPERQAWVMNRLRRLVSICPWGFIFTAMDTLQVLWSLEEKDRGSRSWVQTLKDPDLNFLIV